MKKKKDAAAIKSYLQLLAGLDDGQKKQKEIKEGPRENFTRVKE